jgi:transposase
MIGKPSSPVRREAARKRICTSRNLAARPTHPAWVTAHRRCARDYERLVETSETMIDLAMIDVMGKRLTGGTAWRQWRTMIGPEPTPEIT